MPDEIAEIFKSDRYRQCSRGLRAFVSLLLVFRRLSEGRARQLSSIMPLRSLEAESERNATDSLLSLAGADGGKWGCDGGTSGARTPAAAGPFGPGPSGTTEVAAAAADEVRSAADAEDASDAEVEDSVEDAKVTEKAEGGMFYCEAASETASSTSSLPLAYSSIAVYPPQPLAHGGAPQAYSAGAHDAGAPPQHRGAVPLGTVPTATVHPLVHRLANAPALERSSAASDGHRNACNVAAATPPCPIGPDGWRHASIPTAVLPTAVLPTSAGTDILSAATAAALPAAADLPAAAATTALPAAAAALPNGATAAAAAAPVPNAVPTSAPTVCRSPRESPDCSR